VLASASSFSLTDFASIPVIIILHLLRLIIAVIHVSLWSWATPCSLTTRCSLPTLRWSRFASFLTNHLHIMHSSSQPISRNGSFPRNRTWNISFWCDWPIHRLLLQLIMYLRYILLCFLIRCIFLLILLNCWCVVSITEWKCRIWTVWAYHSMRQFFFFSCIVAILIILFLTP